MSYAHTQLGGGAFNHGPSSSAEAEYDRLRDAARKEQGQHQHFAAEARQAYERGDGSRAHDMSQQSKSHAAQADALNKQASEFIFRENNAVGKVASDTIDLHGQFVAEAEEILEQRIRYAKSTGQSHLHVIVGKGNHSPGHVQKIKPKVEELCRELGLSEHTEHNEGRIYIDLQGGGGGAGPQHYDYSTAHQPQHAQYGQPHFQTAYPMGNSPNYGGSYAQAAGGGYPAQQQQSMQYGGQNGYAGHPQQQMDVQQPQQQQEEGIKCCGIKICVVM